MSPYSGLLPSSTADSCWPIWTSRVSSIWSSDCASSWNRSTLPPACGMVAGARLFPSKAPARPAAVLPDVGAACPPLPGRTSELNRFRALPAFCAWAAGKQPRPSAANRAQGHKRLVTGKPETNDRGMVRSLFNVNTGRADPSRVTLRAALTAKMPALVAARFAGH